MAHFHGLRDRVSVGVMSTSDPESSRAETESQKLRAEARVAPKNVRAFAEQLFGGELHAKRVLSLAMGAVGVLHATSLAIHAVGRGLAAAAGLNSKHATKQVDRLLSNTKLVVWDLFGSWVSFVVGPRKEIVAALDWTEFDKDDQATIALYLVTRHGRATPLIWKTVYKSELKKKRNDYEDEVIAKLDEALDDDVRVTLLADRGFGDQKLYEHLEGLGWGFVIRFRECITVRSSKGVSKPARDWLSPSGRAKMLKNVEVTQDATPLPAVVLVHAKGMKDPWCLASSRADLAAPQVVKLYGRRFTIEETFRDTKNVHFGMGLSATHIGNTARRDRLLLLAAVSHVLLTLLGAAGERAGLDRMLKVNTVKRRTMSLYKQGCFWYEAIPNMPDDRLVLLMSALDEVLQEHAIFREIFGII